MFAEWICELGGVPVTDPGAKTRKSETIGEAMDYGLEQVLREEQLHLNFFQNIDRHIRELGPAVRSRALRTSRRPTPARLLPP